MSADPAVMSGSEAPTPASAAGAAPVARVDLAQIFRDRLFVSGWIFGLSDGVASATLRFGEQTIDLLQLACRVSRPDVTRHLAEHSAADDHHGFCVVVALSGGGEPASSVRLSVALRSGPTAESLWPVGRGEEAVAGFLKRNPSTREALLQHLGHRDAAPFADLLTPAGMAVMAALPFQFDVDLCCVLEGRILLITGWLADPDQRVTAAHVSVGDLTLDFLDGRVATSRPDIESNLLSVCGRAAVLQCGFTFCAILERPAALLEQVVFEFVAQGKPTRLRRTVSATVSEARRDLVALLNKVDADAAITLIEQVAATVGDLTTGSGLGELLEAAHNRAVERLPGSLEGPERRYFLYLDRVVPVADVGVFLNGWFYAEPEAVARVTCHCGFAAAGIESTWVRHPRLDVTQHLNTLGVAPADNDHGFHSFARFSRKSTHHFIAVTSSSGVTRRMRLPGAAAAAAALPTVRSVLTSFTVEHRTLHQLLSSQVGPAVQAAWARREKPPRETLLHRYGPQASSPAVTVIIPLYGRYDLVEYQMALFADDGEFQRLELLYFVDDPAIYDELRLQCADLYATYQVPFSLAFAGRNLGFAGANNRAAQVARGGRLLLMNSDVFPKQHGWVGEMLRVYDSLRDPGVLGVKLLYEDGSVQHAGMSFRRHPPWSDLWINYHPHKGQSPHGLTGVREVEAVTAACALVDADLYRRLGGLSEDYIVGDFEDSDLCLQAVKAGRRNRIALDIELFHLERQSQDRIGDAQWRTNLTVYNCWQHHQRWAAYIENSHS
jgi:GT2 family glycosyltransferase